MPRYIDADAFEKFLKCEIRECEEARDAYYGDEMYDACVNSRETALRQTQYILSATPTADVEEVRHGEWGFDGLGWTCSECGEYALTNKAKTQVHSRHCPHCGAKMDGGVK